MRFPNLLQSSFWSTRRLPVMLQTEMAECGLACVCMIANYWGHRIDFANMRRRFSVSLKGASLKNVMAMAQALSFQARPLKLDMPNLPELKLPCILHWDMNHFVVLKKIAGGRALIHDPAIGERRLPLAEVAKHFSGVALELAPSIHFEKKQEREHFSLRSLMGQVTGLKRGLAHIVLLGLALQVCILVGPFYMQWLVDEALLTADRDLVTVLGMGFLLLVGLEGAIGAMRSWVTTVLSSNLNFQWLGNAFAHLMKLPLAYFEKRHTGDIVSRFASIREVQNSLTTHFVEGIIDGVLVLSTLGMMVLYSPRLAAVAGVAVVIYILLRWMIYRALRDATAEQIIHAAKQQTHFLESVRGVQSIRLFGRQGERHAGWANMLADQFNANLRISKLGITYETGQKLLFGAERVIVIWMAAIAVLNNTFSIGMLFAFISYKEQFSQRMISLIDKLFDLRMLRVHGERIADIVMTPAENDAHDVEIDTSTIEASIEFRNVSFRYADGEPDVITDLNLVIPAGQCIALTGASGGGKTTLVKLMLGLLKPSAGQILVGGVDIERVGLRNYRQMFGTVMQDDVLFAGSLSDNISFFDPSINQARIEACAQSAAIHADILRMPMGYNTLVGDIGSGLSGGQKQRVLLARALYRNPSILVLDEATSHLDVRNEKAVNSAIQDIALTRVIVAHRPDTIQIAGRVVVLQHGKVVQDVTRPSKQEREVAA